MNWYLAKIVYRIICGEGYHAAQFDEQLRLVSAANEEEAFEKAQMVGEAEQEVFSNTNRQLVQWKFINVAELYRISELIDGAELYSAIREVDNAEWYTDFVHRKAQHIRNKSTHQLLNLL